MRFGDLVNSVNNEVNEDVYDDMTKRYGQPTKHLQGEELARKEAQLGTPDTKPYDFDGTYAAWLLRLSLWGEISISHSNPDEGLKRNLTNDQFIDYMMDPDYNHLRGEWKIDNYQGVDKVRFRRTFYGIKGKPMTEEVLVKINLRPDLQDKLKKLRSKEGLLDKFLRKIGL